MLGFAFVWQNPKVCLKPHSIKLYVNMNNMTNIYIRAKGERAWKRQYIERPHP